MFSTFFEKYAFQISQIHLVGSPNNFLVPPKTFNRKIDDCALTLIRFKSCVRKHAAKMHNTAGNDADVITDDIEESKVKLLTNKLRIFYTLSGSGSGMFPGDRGLEIETQEEYDEEFHQAVPDPPSAAATLNHQAVILNSHHSLASLLAAAAAAQQQLAPAASTDDQVWPLDQ